MALRVAAPAFADTASHILKASPSASVFFMEFIPLEFKTGYTLLLTGENVVASCTIVLQLKTYLKF